MLPLHRTTSTAIARYPGIPAAGPSLFLVRLAHLALLLDDDVHATPILILGAIIAAIHVLILLILLYVHVVLEASILDDRAYHLGEEGLEVLLPLHELHVLEDLDEGRRPLPLVEAHVHRLVVGGAAPT